MHTVEYSYIDPTTIVSDSDFIYTTAVSHDGIKTTAGSYDGMYTTYGDTTIGYTTYHDTTAPQTGVTLIGLLSCNISLNDTGCTAGCAVNAIDMLRATAAIIGLICNIMVFITFIKNANVFARNVRVLLGHQSILDGLVCLVSVPNIITCKLTYADFGYLNIPKCYIWSGQFFYWFWLYLSVLNLLLIAIERYLLVCHPFIHKRYVGSYHKRALASCYVISLIINCPDLFMVTYKDEQCLHDLPFNTKELANFVSFYGVFWFIVFYAGPCLCFIIMYRKVLNVLSSRINNTGFGHTNIVASASKRFTKTAITVTMIFVLSMGFDSIFYMLGHIGLTTYDTDLLLTKVGVLLTIANPVSGPFVYIIFMPTFSQTFIKTFSCHIGKRCRRTSREYNMSNTYNTEESYI